MASRFAALRPPYPIYRRERFWGELPSAPINASPDLRPSDLNPSYSVYPGTRGRELAGLGQIGMNIDSINAEGIKDYPNELDLLQESDDVVGNGVFDPAGSHGNVHADYGVFQDHLSLPGYVDRDQFYTPSEVIDATTDRHVMYVPGGAVAIDAGQRRAFENRVLWEIPPGVNPWEPNDVSMRNTMNQPTNFGWPVNGLGQDENNNAPSQNGGIGETGLYVAAGVLGVAIGIFVATMRGTT